MKIGKGSVLTLAILEKYRLVRPRDAPMIRLAPNFRPKRPKEHPLSTIEAAPPTPSRRCSNCPDGVMAPMALEKHAYRTDRRYKCANCGEALKIDAVGFIGLYFWVWVIVSAGLIYLFLWHDKYPSVFSYVVIGLLVGIGGITNLWSLIKHWTHPFVDPKASPHTANDEDDSRQKFDKLLDLGLFRTPLLVFLFVALILMAAATVGVLNDHFF